MIIAMRRALLAFALLSALAAPSSAQQLDRRRVTHLVDSLVAATQARRHVPGMTVLIAQGARALVAKGYGVMDLDDGAPATVETVYAIASITKQFTAAAILQLVREQRLQLDDDVSKHLPGLPMVRGPLTLRQLLHHTAGMQGPGPVGDPYWSRRDYTRDELLQLLGDAYKTRDQEFAPGTQWRYRDINYVILGLVIEKITGQTLWDAFRERFFVPLGMTATAPCDPAVVMRHRARGYVPNDSAPLRVVPAPYVSPTISLGGSGLCSSAMDLLKWQRGLIDGRVLDAASYALMKTPGTLSDGTRLDYGLGLTVWPLGNETMVWHSGGIAGFTSFVGYLPGNDVTFIMLANSNADPWRIGTELARVARGLPLATALPVGTAERSRYVGTYEGSGVTAIVREQDGELRADVRGAPTARFLFSPRLLKQPDASFAVSWEPESRVRFHVTGERADSAALSFGTTVVRLARIQ